MRIYDHVMRTYSTNFGGGAGDLRQSSAGSFGSIQSTCQLFAREAAHERVSNFCERPAANVVRRLSNFEMLLHFDPPSDAPGPSAADMENACLEYLVIGCAVNDVAGSRDWVPMATRILCTETGRVIARPGTPSIVVDSGQPLNIVARIGQEAQNHLNGLVRARGTLVRSGRRSRRSGGECGRRRVRRRRNSQAGRGPDDFGGSAIAKARHFQAAAAESCQDSVDENMSARIRRSSRGWRASGVRSRCFWRQKPAGARVTDVSPAQRGAP